MSFHLFHIDEVFSNANGTVQYIVFVGDSNDQDLWTGRSIVSRHGDTSNTFSISGNLPSPETNGKSVLVATQGFADLGLVTPDYIVEDGFLFPQGGTIEFPGMQGGTLVHGELPFDGATALDGNGQETSASPMNFAGVTAGMTGIPLGELFVGTAAANSLTGLAGHDGIFGEGGNDTMAGGAGNDRLEGGDGADVARGGLGNDLVGGDYGLGFGNDRLFGDAGNDTVAGDEGNDKLKGGAGADMLFGGVGFDVLDGGGGADRLNGEGGNDKLIWDALDARVDGGGGTGDVLVLGVTLNLTTLANNKLLGIERVNMDGNGNDSLILNKAEVLDLSAQSNLLTVFGNAGDKVDLRGTGWSLTGTAGGFETWKNGAAIVKVETELTVL